MINLTKIQDEISIQISGLIACCFLYNALLSAYVLKHGASSPIGVIVSRSQSILWFIILIIQFVNPTITVNNEIIAFIATMLFFSVLARIHKCWNCVGKDCGVWKSFKDCCLVWKAKID
jgi:hypothetical protein